MLARGAVVFANLNPTVGHEQSGDRPCVVVSADAVVAALKFPMMAIVPLTSTAGVGPLYPVIQPSAANGLTNPSTALTDQVRAIDKQRVRRIVGRLSAADLASVTAGLKVFLGF